MINKGNNPKFSNEVIAQVVTDNVTRRMKLGRYFTKNEIKEDSDFYTYFAQTINIEEAMEKGQLGEIKPVAPGVSLQELNVRKPIDKTVSINAVGGVLNINQNMLDKNIISVADMLKDVSALIRNSLEKQLASILFGSSNIVEFDNTAGEPVDDFIISAQEFFKEKIGDYLDMNLALVNYKTITAIKRLFKANNIQVEPYEEIKSYFYNDNIDVIGTATSDGGARIPELAYVAYDYRDAPVKLLYSRTPGTTTAPVGIEGNDFQPVIEILRKIINDELPKYTKIYIQSRVGFLEETNKKAIRGVIRQS